jgi:hypothetical protein
MMKFLAHCTMDVVIRNLVEIAVRHFAPWFVGDCPHRHSSVIATSSRLRIDMQQTITVPIHKYSVICFEVM